eukprot:CAMPEP_0197189628 /NCGR_PEP_ID=MMETSP1423-20130617/20122_1 /TAXON_ID=476441 /ORGANISM="Pseudo-nitzschia heimii, Strain UNC1101" /LENGTH=398 /DNA_ID=CAMNT_0042641797 /DNA_START=348 /DNA_END=1544 /DNA_ORIENTATION=-
MHLYEHNRTISESHKIGLDDDAWEVTRSADYVDLLIGESMKQVADMKQRQQILVTRRRQHSKSNEEYEIMTPCVNSTAAVTHSESPIISEEYCKKKRQTRVIFGIMTYNSTTERQRRDLIRSTFLSYFRKHMNRTLVTEKEYNEKKHWICALNDLDNERLKHPEKCRMAYAFVHGANSNGTSMLLSFNKTTPLVVQPQKYHTHDEQKDASDSVYLNIKENGRFGKSPTWFRYAIDVLERHGWMEEWDYIFKSDTDNLIYTPNFFRYMDKLSKKKAERIYGGLPLDYKKCGGDKHDHCKQMIGPYFMQGGCYFLSMDLAKFITDEKSFDHQAVKLPHEDMTTGNFVYSYPGKIRVVGEPKKNVIRKHPVKKDKSFIFRWKKMLREEQARLSTEQVEFIT